MTVARTVRDRISEDDRVVVSDEHGHFVKSDHGAELR